MEQKIKKGELYLVTGGSGFLGSKLIEYILECGGLVRVLARNEGNLIKLAAKYPVDIFPGDIYDELEVKQAMKGVKGVFHLAACKHIGLAEKHVRETIKINTIGSMNIFDLSLTQDLDFVLCISTDKAAQVAGVYGATKMLMERLAQQYESLNPSCAYRVVRYGNVLYSTGSVLCKWKDLIQKGAEIIVTERAATRFFWTVDEAIETIKMCMRDSTDATPYCPTMKSIKIDNLLDAMVAKYGNGNTISVKEIGLQAGENLHEKIFEEGPYSNEVGNYTTAEILERI
jgi:UDP-N-acetylglucosamine 4,6-dehydratase